MVADPSLSLRSQFQSRRARALRSRASARSRPSSQIESNSGSPARAALDGGVERGHRLARLQAERRRSDARRSSASMVHSHVSTCAITASSTSRDPFGRRELRPTRSRRSRTRRRRRTGSPSARRAAPCVVARSWPIASASTEDAVVEAVAEPLPRFGLHAARRARRASSRRIHSPFTQSSFFGSNTADACVTRSSSNSATSSSGERISRPSAGAHPKQREVVDQRLGQVALRRGTPRPRPRRGASRAWPGRRRGSAAGARTPVAARRPSASRSASTRCVVSMQVLAADDVGDPHVDVVDRVGEEEDRRCRRTARSRSRGSVDHSTSTSPRTRSWKRLTPVSGVRNRTTLGRPSAASVGALARRVRSRHWPS